MALLWITLSLHLSASLVSGLLIPDDKTTRIPENEDPEERAVLLLKEERQQRSHYAPDLYQPKFATKEEGETKAIHLVMVSPILERSMSRQVGQLAISGRTIDITDGMDMWEITTTAGIRIANKMREFGASPAIIAIYVMSQYVSHQ